MLNFIVLTLFPDMFDSVLNTSILSRAIKTRKISVRLVDIRDYAEGRHKVADDTPYGGGAGMVMKPEPIDRCLCDVLHCDGPESRDKSVSRVILMSPQGRVLTQRKAMDLADLGKDLVLLCGHYEGIDERVLDLWVDEELSIGDYVLTGGELAAMTVIDCCSRMVPGVLGHEDSARNDSFMDGILDYPHYTRPPSFRGLNVPDILLSGHHAKIEEWRRRKALEKTLRMRPELIDTRTLSENDKGILPPEGSLE